MLCQKFCGFLGNLLHLFSTICLLQVIKDSGDLVQDLPGELERLYRVLESRGIRVVQYCLKFLFLLLYSRLDGRDIVSEGDLVKRRDAVRGFPFLEERILGLYTSCHSDYRSYS